jgi:hypothetical protein
MRRGAFEPRGPYFREPAALRRHQYGTGSGSVPAAHCIQASKVAPRYAAHRYRPDARLPRPKPDMRGALWAQGPALQRRGPWCHDHQHCCRQGFQLAAERLGPRVQATVPAHATARAARCLHHFLLSDDGTSTVPSARATAAGRRCRGTAVVLSDFPGIHCPDAVSGPPWSENGRRHGPVTLTD